MGCTPSNEADDQMTEQDIYEAFKAMDTDGSGTITAEELREVLRKLDDEVREEDIEQMLKQADTDGDGEIDYAEFARVMRM